MSRPAARLVKRSGAQAEDSKAGSVKMSRDEKLALLEEIERIANSQYVALVQQQQQEHTALKRKLQRLREAIASDN
jgi:hypothetical protein